MATLTVFPDPNPETNTVDGYCEHSGLVWATVRSATAAALGDDSAASNTTAFTSDLNGITFTITRSFFLFNTSSLGAGATISAAVISFNAQGTKANGDSTSLIIVDGTPASNTAIVAEDYDQTGSTEHGSIALSAWVETDGTYNDVTLDASGIAAISKTGITKFAGRLALDLNNVIPTGNNYIGIYFADQAGTSNDPKLVITYTPGLANVKTINGLATASMKTFNGLANASVKSINGLT